MTYLAGFLLGLLNGWLTGLVVGAAWFTYRHSGTPEEPPVRLYTPPEDVRLDWYDATLQRMNRG